MKLAKIGFIIIVLLMGVYGVLALQDHKEIGGISPELLLKADKTDILGNITKDGIVKYAYNSKVPITSDLISVKGLTLTKEAVHRRTKHAKTFETESGKFVTEIISGVPQYYKDHLGDWYQAEYATTTEAVFLALTAPTRLEKLVRIFTGEPALATDPPFYPDANPETDTVDGRVLELTDNDWTTLQGDVGDFSDDANSGSHPMVTMTTAAGTDIWSNISRGIFLYDTSSLPDTDTIDSATISFYVLSFFDTLSISPAYNIYSSNPASNTGLVMGDYDSLGTIEFATEKAGTSLSLNRYNNWILNATGLAAISKTGITKLGLRESKYDAPNIEPSWSASASTRFNQYASERTGTSQDPKLVVVHSAAAPPEAVIEERAGLIWFE